MSNVRKSEPYPLLVLVSDIHLSHRAPSVRHPEENWYAVMANYLGQLGDIAARYNVPIVMAGDIFDYWKAPPELINFAIDEFRDLPDVYTVAGQHDLPMHNLEDMNKSAYGTLLKAECIKHLQSAYPTEINGVQVWGFSYGETIPPPGKGRKADFLSLAVIHAYCWIKGKEHLGAQEHTRLKSWQEKLKGFDVAHFGDNHNPFVSKRNEYGLTISNTGGFIRRRADELDNEPGVGLFMSDGTVRRELFDTSKDRFLSKQVMKVIGEEMVGLSDFISKLKEYKGILYDFEDVLRRFFEQNEVPERVKTEIIRAMENKK